MRFLMASALTLASLSSALVSVSASAAEAGKSCGVVRELVSSMKSKHLLQVQLDNTDTGRREAHTVGAIDVNLSMLTRAVGSPNVEVCLRKLDDGSSTVTNLYSTAR